MSVDELKLIETVRDYECIYNNKIYEYKNALTKQTAWTEIASKLKRSVPDCRTKWNQLRNAFLHVLIRRKSSNNLKKWKFEDELSYLLPFMKHRTNDTASSPFNEINNQHNNSSGTQHTDEYSNGENTPDRNKRKVDNQKDIEVTQEKRPCNIRVGEGVINILPIIRTPEKITLICQEDMIEDEINVKKEKIQPRCQENTTERENNMFHTIHTMETMPARCIEANTEDENYVSAEKMSPSCEEDASEDEINMFNTTRTQKVDFHEEMFHILKEKIQRKKVHKDEIDLLFESLAKAVKQLPKTEQVKVKIGVTKVVYEAQMRCGSQ